MERIMGSIQPFLPDDAVFDPATLVSMGDAFERVCVALHCEKETGMIKEVIAAQIVSLAENGETDPDELFESAMAAIGCRMGL